MPVNRRRNPFFLELRDYKKHKEPYFSNLVFVVKVLYNPKWKKVALHSYKNFIVIWQGNVKAYWLSILGSCNIDQVWISIWYQLFCNQVNLLIVWRNKILPFRWHGPIYDSLYILHLSFNVLQVYGINPEAIPFHCKGCNLLIPFDVLIGAVTFVEIGRAS